MLSREAVPWWIPRNYLIGPNGKVLYQNVGYSPQEFKELTDIIAKELEKVGNRAQLSISTQ